MIIGYIFTAVYAILFLAFLGSTYLSRKDIFRVFRGNADKITIAAALIIVLFFVLFSILYVSPAEQLYFDENIYQGIALNILHNGNALWCQYGSAYTVHCPLSEIYHDPAEWSFYIALAFLFFGTGTSTSYALQLFTGALSILLVFLLGSLLIGKRGGVAAALVFALIPELFIWSRTQAVMNLGMMMFSVLAFVCYIIYDRTRNMKTMTLFLSALGIATYMRIEAALLIPIFAIVYLLGDDMKAVAKRVHSAVYSKLDVSGIIVFAFFLLFIPQIYYIAYELGSMNYGSGTICGILSNHTFSIANFMCNAPTNLNYFAGQYNSVSFFPAYFSPITSIAALIGLLALVAAKHDEKRKIVMLMCLWIAAFFLFYTFFYAGGVTYGVDVRFMLELYPPMAILVAIGINDIADIFSFSARPRSKLKNRRAIPIYSATVFLILLAIFAVYPFAVSIKNITLLPQNMPQEPGPLTATNFIYANYNVVPTSCLVFSFTPDIWFELNRSAAQIGDLRSSDKNFTKFESNYSCFVIDYGYWCSVPPYNAGVCSSDLKYNLTALATAPAQGSGNLSLYEINNYNPGH